MKGKLKSFEELMAGIGYQEPEDLSEYPDVSDEEVGIRLQIFFNGWEVAERPQERLPAPLGTGIHRKGRPVWRPGN